MTDEPQAIHELAPMTDRSPEVLARNLGFPSLDSLIGSLPQGAQIVDFGAGASQLGNKVAKRRPDIHWINFDLNYDREIPDLDMEKAPPNVTYVAGDVLEEPKFLAAQSADVIFSYALLPHLELTSTKVAHQALEAMASILKPEGEMYLGKKFARSLKQRMFSQPGALYLTGEQFRVEKDAVIAEAIEQIRIKGLGRPLQKWSNKYTSSFFNQPRWSSNPEGKPWKMRLFDVRTNRFVPAASMRGLTILTRLGAHIVKGLAHKLYG